MNRPKHFKPRFWGGLLLAPLAVALVLSPGSVYANDEIITITNTEKRKTLMQYWTPERMRKAIPMELLEAKGGESLAAEVQEASWPGDAQPAFAPGWKPGSGPQPDPATLIKLTVPDTLTTPPFSPPASSSDWVNYAPFDRWTWYGRYTTYPTSTIGRLFFRHVGGFDASCTASLIGRRTIATAGHCIAGNLGWHDRWYFCPSYNRNGINPAVGCWEWESATLPDWWLASCCRDRDYGCIVTNPTGSVWNSRVGDITGWTGRAVNFSSRNHTTVWGYPADPPFPGYHVVTCASTEWYERNACVGDGQVSKYVGCDQTGGSTGGPWWLNIRHPNNAFEYSPLDSSDDTDPGQGLPDGPFLNGVTSHRWTSAWVNEVGSPQFRATPGDIQEAEDIFQKCLADD